MNWKTKAIIQNCIAALPTAIGNPLYFQTQRYFGSLRVTRPLPTALAGLETCRQLINLGHEIKGARFLEIGTGRMLTIPIMYWLAGAEKTTTIDLHHYLHEGLVKESLSKLMACEKELFSTYPTIIDKNRWNVIRSFDRTTCLADIEEVTGISYFAPANASRLSLDDASIDFHTSYTVLEHIPHKELELIFKEARRVLKPGGRLIHQVDYSDHFSHTDPSITALNFLQYSNSKWRRLAGNRFMFMNRCRHSDYVNLLKKTNFKIINDLPTICPELIKYVARNRNTFDESFACYSDQDLATTSGWLIASP